MGDRPRNFRGQLVRLGLQEPRYPAAGDARKEVLDVDVQNPLPTAFAQVQACVGEDTPLWPTGVGPGEFVEQGSLEVAGEPAQRVLLVCPNVTNPGGEVTSIWYHDADGQPNITRSVLEFGFIFQTETHCEPGHSLTGKIQHMGEMIIASLNVP